MRFLPSLPPFIDWLSGSHCPALSKLWRVNNNLQEGKTFKLLKCPKPGFLPLRTSMFPIPWQLTPTPHTNTLLNPKSNTWLGMKGSYQLMCKGQGEMVKGYLNYLKVTGVRGYLSPLLRWGQGVRVHLRGQGSSTLVCKGVRGHLHCGQNIQLHFQDPPKHSRFASMPTLPPYGSSHVVHEGMRLFQKGFCEAISVHNMSVLQMMI